MDKLPKFVLKTVFAIVDFCVVSAYFMNTLKTTSDHVD